MPPRRLSPSSHAAAQAIALATVLLVAGCASPATQAPTTPLPATIPSAAPPPPDVPPPQPSLVVAAQPDFAVMTLGKGAFGPGVVYYNETTGGPAAMAQVEANATSVVLGFLRPGHAYQATYVPEQGDAVEVRFATPGATPWPPASAAVAPGAPANGCTLTAILRDATNQTLYGLGAGHCFPQGVGTVVWTAEYSVGLLYRNAFDIGEVVATNASVDWALIRLYDEVRAKITPTIRHWTGPSGLDVAEVAADGDTVCIYGNGDAFRSAEATRHRCGSFWFYGSPDGSGYGRGVTTSLPGWQGDSGSPIIHYASGRLLAMLNTGANGVVSVGPTACGLLWSVRLAGYDLAYVAAPYAPPPADAAVPTRDPPLPGGYQGNTVCRERTLV